MRQLWLILLLALGATPVAPAADWPDTLAEARGQTVYFNAWGGDERINRYIQWAAEQTQDRYGVSVEHVKVTDTADVVTRVLAEKTAGRDDDGSVDLIWINGENFAAMKREGLLFGPWSTSLPNYALVDVAGKPTVELDFGVPVDGLEAPWGMAQLVFMYDSAAVATPPADAAALLAWSAANPGRFSYPLPPDFLGSTFLKQLLIELSDDPQRLQRPVDEVDYQAAVAPLWRYLDRLHPTLWRRGRVFPAGGQAQKRLLGDGELDFALSFSPPEAQASILSGELPASVRTFVFADGTIGNTHFVAIPYNSASRAGAQVFANFLLSPPAQARKMDPRYWGDFTVLDVGGLPPEPQQAFDRLDLGEATLTPLQLGRTLTEPHASWTERLEQDWNRRYGGG